jgi:hypothetical protein
MHPHKPAAKSTGLTYVKLLSIRSIPKFTCRHNFFFLTIKTKVLLPMNSLILLGRNLPLVTIKPLKCNRTIRYLVIQCRNISSTLSHNKAYLDQVIVIGGGHMGTGVAQVWKRHTILQTNVLHVKYVFYFPKLYIWDWEGI